MTNRIFRAIFLVALAVMLTVSCIIMGMMYGYSSEATKKELRREASYIALGLDAEGAAYFERLKETDARITWLDAQGNVLYDSAAESSVMENHSTREEFREALETGMGESVRYSSTLSAKTLYYAKMLSDGTILRVSIETLSFLMLFLTMAYPLALMLIFMIVLSLLLAFQTARNITNPINHIDLEHPSRAEVYEELTPLLHRIAVQNREIKRQMTELKRQKEEFDTITANMQEGLLVLDTEGAVLSYNTGVLRLMGLDKIEEGKNVFSLCRAEAFRRGIEGALAGNHREERLEVNGKVCQLFVNPVFQDGRQAGVILMLFDATEKEERERLRREFTANVSHELKTPLTSISGFAEIMKSGMVRPEDMGNFAGKIYEEAQRLIVLIQDIIKLSKLDEKESFIEREWVRMDAVVWEAEERLQSEAERRSIRLTAQTEEISVYGVKHVLLEMVYNLCDNALRYNRPAGSVSVFLRREGDQAVLEVTDTGIGIAKEEQERIFERFYRVDTSRSAEKGGTGLGLSIVKHGALLHQAKIQIESELGAGTTMRICFPLA